MEIFLPLVGMIIAAVIDMGLMGGTMNAPTSAGIVALFGIVGILTK